MLERLNWSKMMNDKYTEQLGRLIINTYGIKDQDPLRVGKLVKTSYLLLAEEDMRDAREEVNQAQWDEKRADVIGQNGNEGLHYD